MTETADIPEHLLPFRSDGELSGLFRRTDGDVFRWLHYHGGFQSHHSSDVDLVWLDAEPTPHVAAFIEFKSCDESVSFPQAVLFECLSDMAPVLIIRSQQRLLSTDPASQTFNIERFIEMDRGRGSGWIITETIERDFCWGGSISADGDLDPLYDAGLIGWEDDFRAQVQSHGGQALAAVEPENIMNWIGVD